jgi:hypothetical protein
MSHARPDSSLPAASAASTGPRSRSAPTRTEQSGGPRRISVDPASSGATGDTAGTRQQILLVANLLDPPGPDEQALRAPGADVFGHAVIGVHEVSEAFGGETIAVLGHQVIAAFPFERAADAVTAAVEIQRDAVRSATGGPRWSCAVCVVAGEVVDDPAFERIGVQPAAPVVARALQLSRSTPAGSVVADEGTALPASRSTSPADTAADGGGETRADSDATDEADAVVGPATPPWKLGASRVLLEQSDEPMPGYEIVFDAHTASRSARVAVSTSAGRPGPRGHRGPPGNRRGRAPARTQSRPPASAASLRRRPWSEGRVFCWFADRGRGVITSTTGQEFYVDRRFLAVGSELAAGDRVFFVPRDPVARGRNPVAGAVLGDGARLEVRIERSSDEGAAALAVVSDSNGTDQVLPLDVSSVGPVSTGEWLLVKVTGSSNGPVGRPV